MSKTTKIILYVIGSIGFFIIAMNHFFNERIMTSYVAGSICFIASLTLLGKVFYKLFWQQEQ